MLSGLSPLQWPDSWVACAEIINLFDLILVTSAGTQQLVVPLKTQGWAVTSGNYVHVLNMILLREHRTSQFDEEREARPFYGINTSSEARFNCNLRIQLMIPASVSGQSRLTLAKNKKTLNLYWHYLIITA